MAPYSYTVTPDDNGTLLIGFPDFPEAHTWAKDMEEAERRAQDAIDSAIQGRISDKEPIPEPYKAGEDPVVTLSTVRAAKVQVWNIMRGQDMTKAQLARALDWTPNMVDRLFDPRHASRFDQIEDAADVLGAVISLTVTPPKRARKAKESPRLITLKGTQPMAGKKTSDFTQSGIDELAQDKPVVYTFENAAGKPLYIGSAKKGRVGARLQEHLPGGRDPIRGAAKVRIIQKPRIAAAQKTEARMIAKARPRYNKQGK